MNLNSLYISVFLLFAYQVAYAQTWTPLSVGSASDVQYISFPSNDTGYVSLDNGQLRKTTNGALNWSPCTVVTTMPGSIEFVTGQRGFMFAANGVVMTTDGAQSWNYVITNSTHEFVDISFGSPAVGYVSATNNNLDTIFIYKTIDGGATWNLQPTVTGPFNAFYPGIYFTSSDTGFLVAESYILRTTDGGVTWNQEFVVPNSDIAFSFHTPDGTNIFSGCMSTSFITSVDAGDNWNPSTTFTNYPGYGVYFTSASHGYYCGGNGIGSGAIEETNDGGVTWTPAHTGNSFWCMDFPSVGTGYVGGTNGVIVKYSVSSSIVDNTLPAITCSPNPAIDILFINNINVGSQITIFNSLGQTVVEQTAIDNRMQIDVSNLAEGVYFCQLISDGTRSVEQVVIRR